MLPLLQAVDVKTKEYANTDQFTELGSDLLKTALESLGNNFEIMILLLEIVIEKIPDTFSLPFTKLNGICTELVRKLCHTRLQEFLDSYKQSAASKQGNATLKGLNLRDTLSC